MLYDIAFIIFSVFYLPALIFKGKLHSGFRERFGLYSSAKRASLRSCEGAVWIQAVSVGEVALLKSFINSLKDRFPERPIVLSTITRTGNDLARKLFSDKAVVVYFPLDLSFIVRRAVALVRPAVYIMIETEIWPNFLNEIRRNNIPAFLLNGRISDRSYGKYKAAALFLKRPLSAVTGFCMQSATDVSRIISLGAPAERVAVTGNMKFDIKISPDPEDARALSGAMGIGAGAGLIVAGSTHPGEEEAMLSVYKKLIADFPRLKLLIAPRHVERSNDVEALVRKAGFEPVRISAIQTRDQRPETKDRVFMLDTIGRLNSAYSIATAVFVGGSLVRHGGQNPIEPAIAGKAILFGPHTFNFRDVVKAFLDKDAAIEVANSSELADRMRALLKDENLRTSYGNRAMAVVAENSGATERNLKAIGRI